MLVVMSAFSHADDQALITEANSALAQKDYRTAFSEFSVLARHGNAAAQFNLGAFYLNGQGVQKDEKQAFGWFLKSAAQGNTRALQFIRNAAAHGNENAKSALQEIQQQTGSVQGQQHTQSLAPSSLADDKTLMTEANAALVRKDYRTAFSEFSILARHGNAAAQFNLGAFYFNGQGVQKDEKQAFAWIARSAARGNAHALQVIQNAVASGNENAKNAYANLVQPGTATTSLSGADDKAFATSSKTRSETGSLEEPSSSGFLLGLNLGQTGRLTGINNSSSLGLLFGYKFNSGFGVELAYNSLYRNTNADKFLSTLTPGATGTFDLGSISLVGQYFYPLGSQMSLLGSLGFHSSNFKLKSSAAASTTGSSRGLIAGLKIQYDFSRHMGVRGGFDTYTESGGITGTLTEVGIGVIFRF